ncbi:MAG: Type IV pilus biogenesis and competence protein PilQ precursor [Syntrophorhabdus sp. PtaU1.Bin058]|nr:MAG: Type IV pilus biogenesis and competence protein PilQ precursor [Syntrophorhabdus sp. PtaU1.Bin058]
MKKGLIFVVMLLVLVSCAHIDQAKEKKPEEAKAAAKPVDIPSPVSFQMEKAKAPDSTGPQDYFSFSLREADVKDILRAIAKQTNYNVVTEPDVKGVTTVDLKNVTLEKALEYILEPLGFAYKIEGRTIYASKPKIETKIFTINYLALKKIGTSTVEWKSGGTSSTSSTGGTTSSETKTLEVKSETESDLWKSLEDNLKAILSADGKLIINKQTFTIMVTDYPRNLKRVSMFLENIERTMHRQIMIEAKIVEVKLSEGFRMGVNWQLVNSRLGSVGRISATQSFPAPANFLGDYTEYFRFYVGSEASGELNITNTYIDLLKAQGETKVLATPKIATLNNQRAIIKSTTQDVYFEEQQSSTGGAATIATYSPRFMNVGIVLDVIPQIDNESNIILGIHPIYSTKDSSVNSPNPNSKGTVPVISTRETDTIVRVKDGETVIIAGILYETKYNDEKGIPLFSSIPLFGYLFKSSTEQSKTTELIVFLTPRIIYDKAEK